MPPGCEFAWNAFWALHNDRPFVTTGYVAPMGAVMITPRPGRIPFSAIDGYASRFGIGGSAFDLLADLVGKLDAEFMEWDGERAAARATHS